MCECAFYSLVWLIQKCLFNILFIIFSSFVFFSRFNGKGKTKAEQKQHKKAVKVYWPMIKLQPSTTTDYHQHLT